MSIAQHTPGPYRLIPHANRSDEYSVEGAKGQMVANFAGAGKANRANAILFICAPKMLAALKRLLNAADGRHRPQPEDWEEAAAVLLELQRWWQP